VEEALEDAGTEEDALPLAESDGFGTCQDFPCAGGEEASFDQFHVVVSVDEDVVDANFAVELFEFVEVFEGVDEADGDLPDCVRTCVRCSSLK
jgi:hypothetical protein